MRLVRFLLLMLCFVVMSCGGGSGVDIPGVDVPGTEPDPDPEVDCTVSDFYDYGVDEDNNVESFSIDYSVDYENVSGLAFFSQLILIDKQEVSLSEVEDIIAPGGPDSIASMASFTDESNIKVSFEYDWAENRMHTELSHNDFSRSDTVRPDESFEKLYLLVCAYTMTGINDDITVESIYDWEVVELPLQNY